MFRAVISGALDSLKAVLGDALVLVLGGWLKVMMKNAWELCGVTYRRICPVGRIGSSKGWNNLPRGSYSFVRLVDLKKGSVPISHPISHHHFLHHFRFVLIVGERFASLPLSPKP
jgi:hypothetical protein